MSDVKVEVLLEYLKDFKTRKQIEAEFDMSNTQSFRLLTWLKKGNYIEEMCVRVTGLTNRQWYYKAK